MTTKRARFDEKWCPEPNSGCHLWTGSVAPNGYGKLWARTMPVGAHRVSWELHHGPIPTGMRVLHKCDTPPCVNPAHLFLGTDVDNMADMTSKGRRVRSRGDHNGSAKLTDASVMLMREKYDAGGVLQKDLMAEFDVAATTVSAIVRRKIWMHLP